MTQAAKKIEPETGDATPVMPLGLLGRTPQVPENMSDSVAIKHRPMEQHAGLVKSLSHEILSQSNYQEDFGPNAPPQKTLASNLARCAVLDAEVIAAKAWLAFLEHEREVTWHTTLEQTQRLQQFYMVNVASDPNIAPRYPVMRAFMGVRSGAADRAVATRKKNRDAKKKATPPETPT
jgi:hypothetical protein